MDTAEIVELILEFQEKDPGNRIPAEIAKKPEYAGRKIYDGVLCGVAAADDPVIVSLKNNKDANMDLMQPGEWLPGAKSVVSFFMPFAAWIVDENTGGEKISGAWLHGRIEGQAAIVQMASTLVKRILEEGNEALVPILDPRFRMNTNPSDDLPGYTSNWSERHVAFAAGLGTFGLSGGLITRLGTAGRLISIVTSLPLDPTPLPYDELLEYCSKCGTCIKACPPNAISFDHPKNNSLCDAWLEKIKEQENPYYGCGKCQCGMPCENGIPNSDL